MSERSSAGFLTFYHAIVSQNELDDDCCSTVNRPGFRIAAAVGRLSKPSTDEPVDLSPPRPARSWRWSPKVQNQIGFTVLPRRWVVEHFFARVGGSGRLPKGPPCRLDFRRRLPLFRHAAFAPSCQTRMSFETDSRIVEGGVSDALESRWLFANEPLWPLIGSKNSRSHLEQGDLRCLDPDMHMLALRTWPKHTLSVLNPQRPTTSHYSHSQNHFNVRHLLHCGACGA
jgi:hypothetical protein